MLKDNSQINRQAQIQEDLQFILSSIRARQNGFIFFLQRLKHCQSINSSEFKLSKNQYQEKQKIYTLQIAKMISKHSQSSTIKNYAALRAFWVKLKTIIKVSLDRISSLNLQNLQKLNDCYSKALIAITRCSDNQKSLTSYKQIQNYFKKKNIQTLLLGRQALSPSSVSYSQSKIQKNRSETLFKPETAVSRFTIQNQDSNIFSKGETFNLLRKDKIYKFGQFEGLTGIQQQNIKVSEHKIKSLNRLKNRKPQNAIKANILNFIKVQQLGKLKSSSKASQKYIKKINRYVQKYEKNFQGAFDAKYEVSNLLDKKKTIFQNIYVLYDNLFAKNIPNHKMISKFMFNTTKINQMIYNAYQKRKKMNKKQKQKNQIKEQKQTKMKVNQEKKINQEKRTNEQKQKINVIKSGKINRKLHSAKDFNQHENILNNLTLKQYHYRQKKQSQLTAITSKNNNNYQKQLYFDTMNTQKNQKVKNQKPDKQKLQKQKTQKQRFEKQKTQKQKEKKVLRSKTAKIKLNSQVQPGNNPSVNNQLQNINGTTNLGKHFVSQNHKQISIPSKGLDRFNKIIISHN